MSKKKRAQSQYLSWIVLLAIVIGISFMLYKWSLNQAQQRSEELQQRTDPLICAQIGISVDGVCQDYRSLRLNVTNVASLDVDGLNIQTVGLYPEDENYLDSQIINTEIKPEDTEIVTVLKKSTLTQIKVVPLGTKNKKVIHCEEQSITKEKSNLKQCR